MATPSSEPDPLAGDASQPQSALTAFFRHHGVWAPGVKLLRRLQFGAKAVIISLAFCIPAAVLSWSYFGDRAGAIAQAATQRDGVAYLREVLPLAQLARQHRAAAFQAAFTGKDSEELVGIRAAQAAHTGKLDAVDQRLGARLETSQAMQTLRVAAARTHPQGGRFEATFDAHAAHAEALDAMVVWIVRRSKLGLNADLDTVDLVNAALTDIPELIQSVAQMNSRAQALANDLPPADERTRAIARAQPDARLSAARLKATLERIEATRPDLKRRLDAQGSVPNLHSVHDTWASGAAGTAGIDKMSPSDAAALLTLQGKLLDELDGVLRARLSALTAQRDTMAVVVVLALLGGTYLFYSFFLVTRGGVREVQRHLEAMTAGDLTTRPRPWGKDEAATLMGTLSDTQVSLRKILSGVRSSSASLVHSSMQIAAASTDLSSRTGQTVAKLRQSASSMESMSSTVTRTSDNVAEAAEVASSNSKVAAIGGRVIEQALLTMQGIGLSSNKINEIIHTINSIAIQANVLALNATIEAARAGEQGRGFAVVAGEVRSLAQRSANAAKDIEPLITGSVDLVASGTSVVKGAGETMQQLVRNAQRMHDLLSDISSAATGQRDGIHLVGDAVHELRRITQRNAALVEQNAASASALKDQAIGLAAEVSSFRLPA